MKESLLCSVLVFLADTPKSAGKHVIQGKPAISQRSTTVIIYFPNIATQSKHNSTAQLLISSVHEMNTK